MKVRLIAVALLACVSMAAMAQDPSIHEVYQAADRGQMVEAQRMMAQVLKDHPGSAKAHFVEAELLARQGQIAQARVELAQADRLQPGLPFAQPAAVNELRTKLAAPQQEVQGNRTAWVGAPVPAPAPHLPWGLIIGGVALAGLAFAWMRSRSPSQPGAVYGGQAVLADRPYGGGMGGYGGGMPYPGGPVPTPGGGLGSQMLGGLATGAAMGAGVVAGEALMHRIMGDDQRSGLASPPGFDATPVYEPQPDPSYDMGGQDFGLNDAGSWDDGGSAGGDDWN